VRIEGAGQLGGQVIGVLLVGLRLADVPPALVQEALAPGRRLVARVRLTDSNGNPICARLRPPYIQWRTE